VPPSHGGLLQCANRNDEEDLMLGGLLALLAAATFGFNNASVRRGVLNSSVLQGMAITVPIGVPLFLLAAVATGQLGALFGLPLEAMLFLAAAGVMHFIWGRYCNYRATKAVGGNLSGPFQQANLVIALVLAIVLLNESLTPLKILGIALVVLGAAVTVRAKPKKPAAGKSVGAAAVQERAAFEPKYMEGYSFALLSAVGYGVSPILVRMGLENAGAGASLAGGLISYSAAAVVITLIMLLPGQWRHVRAIDPGSIKWFTLSGFLVFLSQMFRYIALSIAPVTVVAPIQATSAAFRVVFAWIINRDHEVFGLWVVLGILISMLGAVALSVSTDIVLAHVALPDFLVEIANWRWP
jgi:drug/metabolite transporter (DMT)-like permease